MKLRIGYTQSVELNEDQGERGAHDFIFICPSYLECVLAVADADDLSALREWLGGLGRKSYGRVFVEIDDLARADALAAPTGVGITWIERGADDAPGAGVARAVEAWLDEWLRADPLSGRHINLWAGQRVRIAGAGHWDRVAAELDETWLAAAEYRDQLA